MLHIVLAKACLAQERMWYSKNQTHLGSNPAPSLTKAVVSSSGVVPSNICLAHGSSEVRLYLCKYQSHNLFRSLELSLWLVGNLNCTPQFYLPSPPFCVPMAFLSSSALWLSYLSNSSKKLPFIEHFIIFGAFQIFKDQKKESPRGTQDLPSAPHYILTFSSSPFYTQPSLTRLTSPFSR